jgi:nucleotide-binding universal stress UspA family protein
MNDLMKILIAYDGSSSAEAALDDLGRAGMPETAQAVALSVVEQWMPVPRSFGMVDMHLTEDSPNPNERAILLSQAAAKHVRMDFPAWEVNPEARIGSPATVILEKAEEWGPDLIVLGPSGHSALGRWILGSVSQKVMTHARCSVRLARVDQERADGPIRVAIGVDGSPGAELAAPLTRPDPETGRRVRSSA